MIHKLTPQSEWSRRVAKQSEPKKRGPPKGTRMQGRPPGDKVTKGRPVAMSLGELVLKFME